MSYLCIIKPHKASDYMEKKFVLSDVTKEVIVNGDLILLRRIKACRDFSDVKKGEFGGWVEVMDNLSQNGDCWLYDDSMAIGQSKVSDNATLYGNSSVIGNSMVNGNAVMSNNSKLSDNARLNDNAELKGSSVISGNAAVYENAHVMDKVKIGGCALVYGSALVFGDSVINGGKICGNAMIMDAIINGGLIDCYAQITHKVTINDSSDYLYFKNPYNDGIEITWTRQDDTWHIGLWQGTTDELLQNARKSNNMYHEYLKALTNVVAVLKGKNESDV